MPVQRSAVRGLPRHLPPALRARLADGQCLTLQQAQGVMVWHAWQPASADPQACPLVLLHGGGGSWTHWVRNIVPLLNAGRAVYAVDLPGFGDSDSPASGGDADVLSPLLAAALETLFPGQTVDLVGFSFGGMTAGIMLAQYPHLGHKLVLVGAPAMGIVPERQFRLKGWRHLRSEAQQMAVHRYNLCELMLHDEQHVDALALELHAANVARDRMQRRRLSRTDILARSLTCVPCPVYAIYGAHDALYGPYISALPHALRQACKNFADIEFITDAGHWAPYEAPQAFHRALMRCLNEDEERLT